MTTYTVHEPSPPNANPAARAERMVFIREGFSWPGLVFGVLWLPFRGLWLEFAVLGALAVGLAGLVMAAGGSPQSASWAMTFVNLIVAFEINNLHRMRLERKGWRMVGVVSAAGFEDCERRFFQNWEPASAKAPPASAAAFNAPREAIGFWPTDRA
ncbi:MAG: DUF2628 domain-containing protein [Hyphomicrobiales bacterium]|nr:DUF2628 domain-containing protein [Hyphomicrobiales bacterium]